MGVVGAGTLGAAGVVRGVVGAAPDIGLGSTGLATEAPPGGGLAMRPALAAAVAELESTGPLPAKPFAIGPTASGTDGPPAAFEAPEAASPPPHARANSRVVAANDSTLFMVHLAVSSALLNRG
jgi:hypothetical protein